MSAETIADPHGFILANTRLKSPPHTPEIALYLADEITPIWRMTEEELGRIGLPPPFWAFAWAGGQALARYLLDHPAEVKGGSVFDVGTGSGLVAVAAMQAGAKSAAGADIDGFCAAAVDLNGRANGVAVGFVQHDPFAAPPPKAEVICAGDVFYEQPLADRAMAWLAKARDAGARVLLGDPGRSYFPKSGLIKLAEYSVETTRELEDSTVKRTAVWTFPGA
ncbi:MAG TPA: methyltransferase [Caulobacteraceae bacterium]|nr:methyltransferase [Caulobacteraceae bacterium]